ncbi:hypothetical protein [Natrinema pallidum]|uniref:Uncharacterized protein n=1 Tax=Natrinema pallidum TaxID=69527 RepID=A0A4P9TJV5_9EURY|nr:hypothetical protein [Natrinema pallidum]QCW05288.1 hypothetical protein FGF80_18780 [Natrinema pallidum]
MSGNGTKRVTLEVTWTPDGPESIDYFHNTFGLMRFHVDGNVAEIDPDWSRLGDRDLKDDFDRWTTTGDVIKSVQDLPFIDEVAASDLHDSHETEEDKSEVNSHV